jgi:hypothetical protein
MRAIAAEKENPGATPIALGAKEATHDFSTAFRRLSQV